MARGTGDAWLSSKQQCGHFCQLASGTVSSTKRSKIYLRQRRRALEAALKNIRIIVKGCIPFLVDNVDGSRAQVISSIIR